MHLWSSAPKPTPTFKSAFGGPDIPEGDVRVVDAHNIIKAANVRRVVGAGGLAEVRREGNKTTAAYLASDFVRGKATIVVQEKNETEVTDKNGRAISYIADDKFDAVRRAFLGIKAEQIDVYPVNMLRRMLKKFSKLDPTHSMSAEDGDVDQMEVEELRFSLKNVLETISLQYQG